jgi:hypothetical protein
MSGLAFNADADKEMAGPDAEPGARLHREPSRSLSYRRRERDRLAGRLERPDTLGPGADRARGVPGCAVGGHLDHAATAGAG